MVIGRKNWLFYGSDHGGRTGAILASVIASAKRIHIDPFRYLRDVFGRIAAHPKNRLIELLPDHWAAEHNHAGS